LQKQPVRSLSDERARTIQSRNSSDLSSLQRRNARWVTSGPRVHRPDWTTAGHRTRPRRLSVAELARVPADRERILVNSATAKNCCRTRRTRQTARPIEAECAGVSS
jgi:hypothetical protein